MFDFSQSRIGGYPTDAVQSVPIDYATGGYGPGDVSRIQREQLAREGREQASFLAYLNAVAAGAPPEQLAQINPMQHYMQTGDRYMPVGDEMLKIGNGQFDIPGMIQRAGLRKDVQTKGLQNAASTLDLTGQETAKKSSELWKRTPMQMALDAISPDDAMRAVMTGLNVPQFYGDTGIPTKYQHELDVEEKKGEKVKEATKLGYAKLLEQSGFHAGTLANAGQRNALLGQGQQDDLSVALMKILQGEGQDFMNPAGAQNAKAQLLEMIAEALANRRQPEVSGPGMPRGGNAQLQSAVTDVTKELNSRHGSVAVGSTTIVPIGEQNVRFIKQRTGWKVQQGGD